MLIFLVRHGLTDWNVERRFQGLTREQCIQRFPEAFAAYMADQEYTAPPEGESFAEVQLRAVVGIPLKRFGDIDVSNGSISVIESARGKRRLITLNGMSHFGDPYGGMTASRLLI